MLEFDLVKQERGLVYDMAVNTGDMSIDLVASKRVAAFVIQSFLRADSPILPILQENLYLPDFISPIKQNWGFYGLIETLEGDDQVVLRNRLPSSKEDYRLGFAVSANLKLLFSCLSFAESDPEATEKQLAHISMDTRRGSAPIAAYLGISLMPWLHAQPDNYHNPEIEGIMLAVYHHLRGGNKYPSQFEAWFRQPKWVNFSCPGNACGLDPTSYHIGEEEPVNKKGYKLLPHNLDSVDQQLTLLAGVAAMIEQASKDLK